MDADEKYRSKSFERSWTHPVNGIYFVWEEGVEELYAPYSFLSHVHLKGGEELVFEYSFGTVTVKGCGLIELHTLIAELWLTRVIEQKRPELNKNTWVKSIRFEPLQDIEISEPLIPRKQ